MMNQSKIDRILKQPFQQRIEKLILLEPNEKQARFEEWVRRKDEEKKRELQAEAKKHKWDYRKHVEKKEYMRMVQAKWTRMKKAQEEEARKEKEKRLKKLRQEKAKKKKNEEIGARLYKIWLRVKEEDKVKKEQQEKVEKMKKDLEIFKRKQLARLAFRLWLKESQWKERRKQYKSNF